MFKRRATPLTVGISMSPCRSRPELLNRTAQRSGDFPFLFGCWLSIGIHNAADGRFAQSRFTGQVDLTLAYAERGHFQHKIYRPPLCPNVGCDATNTCSSAIHK
jgi:hypothetical protein